MSNMTFTVGEDKKSLIITRSFRANKSKLWQAYAEAHMFAQWWGPTGWSTEVKRLDFTPGGQCVYIMRSTTGDVSAGIMSFTRVTPESSFEYIDTFTDEKGNELVGLPKSRTLVELDDSTPGETTLVSTTFYETEQALQMIIEMGVKTGIEQTFDKLDAYVTQ